MTATGGGPPSTTRSILETEDTFSDDGTGISSPSLISFSSDDDERVQTGVLPADREFVVLYGGRGSSTTSE